MTDKAITQCADRLFEAISGRPVGLIDIDEVQGLNLSVDFHHRMQLIETDPPSQIELVSVWHGDIDISDSEFVETFEDEIIERIKEYRQNG